MPFCRYVALRSASSATALSIAEPIGVAPAATSVGAWKASAVTKCWIVCTGPKVTIATSTRLAAMASDLSSSANVWSPLFNSLILSPLMEVEVSKSRRQGHRGSGFSAKSTPPKGT